MLKNLLKYPLNPKRARNENVVITPHRMTFTQFAYPTCSFKLHHSTTLTNTNSQFLFLMKSFEFIHTLAQII